MSNRSICPIDQVLPHMSGGGGGGGEGSYSSVEMKLVFSTAPADWAKK